MKTIWTKHLKDPEKKSDFEKEVLSCRYVLNHLKKIAEERKEEIARSELSEEAFGTPNWDYIAARNIGRKQELDALIQILTLDQGQ